MARDTTSSNVLPIGQIFKSSGILVSKYIPLWLVLTVVLHFISWKFVTEMGDSLQQYIMYMFGPQMKVIVKEYLEEFLEKVSSYIYITPEHMNKVDFVVDLTKSSVIALGHFALLQVIASQMIYDQLVCCQKEAGIGSVLQRIKTTDFFFDTLRTIGITAIYYGILCAGLVLCFVLAAVLLIVLQNFSDLIVLPVIYSCKIIFLCFLSNTSRLFLAVPLIVVENTKILESLKRSWHMTASCWIKLSIVVLLTGVLMAAFFVLLILVLLESDSNVLLLRIYVILTPLYAIVMSVCYCYLRSPED